MVIKDDDLKDYWMNKLLLPKIFVIDKPGVVISRTSRFFGCNITEKRNLYHFDKIFLQLRVATVKKMGIRKSSDFFYRMGKDLGTGYMILGKAKRVPNFLLQRVMGSIHKIISTTGTTVFDEISFSDGGYCILNAKDGSENLKNGGDSFFAGVYSGILSFLSGCNFEAQHGMKDGSKIIIKPSIVERYVPDMKKLKLPDNYSKVNFPDKIPYTSRPCFSDLLRFGKAKSDAGNISYRGKDIFSTEQGMFDLITEYYIDEGLEDFFRRKVVGFSQDLADEIFFNKSELKNNLEEMINMFCAFGWGIPEYVLKEGRVVFLFACAPISKSPPLYRALIINGFLNSITGNKYVLEKVSGSLNSSTVKIYYNKV